MKITVTERPYTLTFHATGQSYPLTSQEAQRLLNEYPAVRATRNRVVLPGHNTADPKQRATIRPATIGGGHAFVITREPSNRDTEIHDRLLALGFDKGARGCSQCQALSINGTPTHEAGCPNQTFECKGCNARVSRKGSYCEDCR